MNRDSLYGLCVEATSRCNYRCVGCSSDSLLRGRGDMDPELFFSIFREAGNEITSVSLWNYGEPLMHPKIVEMLNGIRGYSCRKILSTNGSTLEDFEDLHFLASLDELIVSIDGLTPEVYAMHQRGGDFEKVKRGVRKLVPQLSGSKTLLTMQIVSHKGNLHQLPQAHEFAEDLGFSQLVIKSFNVLDLSQRTFEDFVPLGTKYSRYNKGSLLMRPSNISKALCLGGMAIGWEGSAYPCCFDYKGAHVLGNVRQQGLYGVWNSPASAELRRRISLGNFLDICILDCSAKRAVVKEMIK